ncbi:MAG: AMP-binding protein [Devosia sp.]|nr:AMP-binding protein [Devosia sp.]
MQTPTAPGHGTAEQDTLPQRLAAVAAAYPDNTLYVFHGRRATYAQFAGRVDAVAAMLAAQGVRSTDRVAFLSQNRPEYLELLFAANRLGASLVPLNTRFGVVDLREALKRCGARLVFHSGSFRKHDYTALLGELSDEPQTGRFTASAALPELERCICMDDESATGYEALVAGAPATVFPLVRQDAVSLMIFTSGTSGFPKPVMLTQGQLVRNMERIGHWQGVTHKDCFLSFLSYFHIFGGALSVLVPFFAGARIAMLEAFDSQATLRLAQDERCTVIYSVNPAWRSWLDEPDFDKYDLSSVRTGICTNNGAAQLGVALKVRERIAPMFSQFGMTETAGVVALTRPDDDNARAARDSGVALPGVELGIFEPGTSVRCAPDAEGELRVRGDMVTIGYFRMPEETAKAIDAQGWLHTGDRARIDADGRLLILGRLNERLRCGAENIDPKEVEHFISTHPAILRCQLVGVPDDRLGEIPVAFVIQRPSPQALDEHALRAFCMGRIADFKIPRRIFFVDEFPGYDAKVSVYKMKEDAIRRVAADHEKFNGDKR